MKLARINFQLAKKKDIEDKKITNEINYKKRILKIKKTNFEHPKTYKDIYHDNYGEIFSNKKFIDKEKKFILKKEKLMKRFHEIMKIVRRIQDITCQCYIKKIKFKIYSIFIAFFN